MPSATFSTAIRGPLNPIPIFASLTTVDRLWRRLGLITQTLARQGQNQLQFNIQNRVGLRLAPPFTKKFKPSSDELDGRQMGLMYLVNDHG